MDESPTGGTGGETGIIETGGEPGAGGKGSDKSLLQRLTQSRRSWNKTEGKRSTRSRLGNVGGSGSSKEPRPVGGVEPDIEGVSRETRGARQARRDDRMRGLQSMFVFLFVFLILLAILYVIDQLLLKGKLGTKIRYGLLTGGGVLTVLISLWAGFTFIKRGKADYDPFDNLNVRGAFKPDEASFEFPGRSDAPIAIVATVIGIAIVVGVAVAISKKGVRL